MTKLTFTHGPVSAGKSSQLLRDLYQRNHRQKTAFLIKPAAYARDGVEMVSSRIPGFSATADMIIPGGQRITREMIPDWARCVFVDEAQFLTELQCEDLWAISQFIPVMCYGLRTTFRGRLFVGSRRLMELACTTKEVRTVCANCPNTRATFNLKLRNGSPVHPDDPSEPDIEEGQEELYVPVCSACFYRVVTGS